MNTSSTDEPTTSSRFVVHPSAHGGLVVLLHANAVGELEHLRDRAPDDA